MEALRDRYKSALQRLPISNPSEADFDALAPHLISGQAQEFLEANKVPTNIFIDKCLALPPLLVRDSYHRLALHDNDEIGRVLDLGFPMRASSQVERVGKDFFVREAQGFALQHWGQDLSEDTWVDVIIVQLVDPTSMSRWSQKITERIYLGTQRPIKSYSFSNSFSGFSAKLRTNVSQAESTGCIALGKEGGEMIGDREEESRLSKPSADKAFYTIHNCALCGGVFNSEGCKHCGKEFSGGTNRDYKSLFPLPRTVKNFLALSGYQFNR